jgi:hypothetical protein
MKNKPLRAVGQDQSSSSMHRCGTATVESVSRTAPLDQAHFVQGTRDDARVMDGVGLGRRLLPLLGLVGAGL